MNKRGMEAKKLLASGLLQSRAAWQYMGHAHLDSDFLAPAFRLFHRHFDG
jgi:hypothetical protein